MPTLLFLLFCISGHGLAKEPPDVDCVVRNMEYVHCSWSKSGVPELNYTFHTRSEKDKITRECATYVSENRINTGCDQPYSQPDQTYHFDKYHTYLVHGNNSYEKEHDIKQKVILNPPTNLTVQNGSDSNLWFYWNNTRQTCVESEVQYHKNNNKWETSKVSSGRQSFCINLPCSSCRYELQVRAKITSDCGNSEFWSDWSEPVVWGSNNSTEPYKTNAPMFVWTPVMTVLGVFTLVLLVLILLHHERIRFIPVLPKPSLTLNEDWFPNKGLKESFQANYNERACPVREYNPLSQSESDVSTCSFTSDQSECSVSIPEDKSEHLVTP